MRKKTSHATVPLMATHPYSPPPRQFPSCFGITQQRRQDRVATCVGGGGGGGVGAGLGEIIGKLLVE
jgi:hypothetical protein